MGERIATLNVAFEGGLAASAPAPTVRCGRSARPAPSSSRARAAFAVEPPSVRRGGQHDPQRFGAPQTRAGGPMERSIRRARIERAHRSRSGWTARGAGWRLIVRERPTRCRAGASDKLGRDLQRALDNVHAQQTERSRRARRFVEMQQRRTLRLCRELSRTRPARVAAQPCAQRNGARARGGGRRPRARARRTGRSSRSSGSDGSGPGGHSAPRFRSGGAA
jgi:hypothetical protein